MGDPGSMSVQLTAVMLFHRSSTTVTFSVAGGRQQLPWRYALRRAVVCHHGMGPARPSLDKVPYGVSSGGRYADHLGLEIMEDFSYSYPAKRQVMTASLDTRTGGSSPADSVTYEVSSVDHS